MLTDFEKVNMLMELVKPCTHMVSFPNSKVLKPYDMSPWITFEVYGLHNGYIICF